MKILVTGFEPFGGEDVNPSWEAVQRLQAPEGTELIRLRLPVVFREAGEQLAAALRREQPDLVLCIGQAAGRDAITPERLGVNLMDASIPDNAGFQPQEEPVIPGACRWRRWPRPSGTRASRPGSPTARGFLCATPCSTGCCTRWKRTIRRCGAALSTSPACRSRRSGWERGKPCPPWRFPRSSGACSPCWLFAPGLNRTSHKTRQALRPDAKCVRPQAVDKVSTA